MKIIMDMVISVNGMIAREDGSEDWLPHEGYEDMLASVERFNNLVYGHSTYEYITKNEDAEYFSRIPTENQIMITTRHDLEPPVGVTIAHSPNEAIKILEGRGIDVLYLIGGGMLNNSFLAQGMVDEIRLTTYPYLLSHGKSVFGTLQRFEYQLELVGTEQLNLGRVRHQYHVKKKGNTR